MRESVPLGNPLDLTLILTTEFSDNIRNHAISTYPDECCGVLIGQIVGAGKYISQVVSLINLHEDGPGRRFRIDAKELMHLDRLARTLNSSIIGFYHSHPDVDPVPSQYDLDHAWETYSYAIVKVTDGVDGPMRSWVLDPSKRIFIEENITVNDCILEISARAVHNAEEVAPDTAL